MATVRCSLPKGYTIEVGTPGKEDYAYYDLAPGTPKKPSAQNIPSEVMERWLKVNAKLRYVLDKSIYIER